MRYRLVSTSCDNDVLKYYPMLDRFNIEAVSDVETYYYITINTLEDLHDLMNYVGAIVIDNFVVRGDRHQCYYEPTIEIYDAPREGFIQED